MAVDLNIALPQPAVHAEPAVRSAPAGTSRLDAIDLVRGLVIVIMALDHVKGNISQDNATFTFVDLCQTAPSYFLTRWVTHFCAPVFVFLAGTGAFLYGARGRSKGELAWFLLSRGIWLIVLELTVIRFAWKLNVNYHESFGQVIWAIGWSMIVLAVLVYLPLSAIAVFSLSMIAFHNLADNVTAADWGELGWLWRILHTGEHIDLADGYDFHPFYPLIPWIGVLGAGYCFGSMMLLPPKRRVREVLGLGVSLTLGFLVLRYFNVYGDKGGNSFGTPGPWQEFYDDRLFTALSFINCQKYPPSLDFLLMTLGPAITLLALLDFNTGPVGRFFIVFGRVPLFFYLLHWYLIKMVAAALAVACHGRVEVMNMQNNYGYSLTVVYLVWLGVVAFLFPLCLWFAGVKRRSQAAWLRYL